MDRRIFEISRLRSIAVCDAYLLDAKDLSDRIASLPATPSEERLPALAGLPLKKTLDFDVPREYLLTPDQIARCGWLALYLKLC